MGLFTPLYKSKDPEKRIKWINESWDSQNQKHIRIIENIARNDCYGYVREVAIDKITDQVILSEIIKKEELISILENAFKKITEQNLYIDIAKNAQYSDIRKTAVKNLIDKEILLEIEKSENDRYVLMEVSNRLCRIDLNYLENLTDQQKIAEIAKNNKDEYVVEKAVANISDPDLLNEIAKESQYYFARKYAYIKLGIEGTQTALIDEAKNGVDTDRLIAIKKIKNISLKIELLIVLFQNSSYGLLKLEIAKILKKLFQNKKLTESDKTMILILDGEEIHAHWDYYNHSDLCGRHSDDKHEDKPEEYFDF